MLGLRTKSWGRFWHQQHLHEAEDTREELRRVLRLAMRPEEQNAAIKLEDFDRTVRGSRAATGQGPDALGPTFIKALPSHGRQTLVNILNCSEEKMACPCSSF